MNSQLYNKTYQIPSEIISQIKRALMVYPQGDGIKRGKMLANANTISYSELKRLNAAGSM